MSVQAMARVMESSEATGMTRLVLLVLANHETEDRGAFPSVDRIAKEARCSVRTVQDAIGRAKKMGELEVQMRAGPNGTNIYRVLAGARGAAPLPTQEPRTSAGVQNLQGADVRRESAPERKELGVQGSSEGSSSALRTTRSALFEEFWAVYPRRVGKRKARAAFTAANRRAPAVEILAGAARYRDDPNRVATFTAHPTTWLNRDGWEDEPLPPPVNGAVREDSSARLRRLGIVQESTG